jgi:hypothetical protein
MPEPEHSIKKRIREAKLTVLKVADALKMPYGTLASQLNGFSPLTSDTRRRIEQVINEATKK